MQRPHDMKAGPIFAVAGSAGPTLLQTVERALQALSLSPTAFGREAIKDPALVFDLRRGRAPSPKTERRVRAFIAEMEARHGE